MDTIMAMHSGSVTLSQLRRGKLQLMNYLEKFRNRLKGKNRVYVAQTVRLIDSIISYLQDQSNQKNTPEGVVLLANLMAGKGVDQINVFKLAAYLQESKLARKVDGYVESQADKERGQATKGTKMQRNINEVPVLMHIQAFLLTLMNPSAEGKFFYSRADDDVSLRYLLLDPMAHFRDIVEEARAIILCGGTMAPMEDFVNQLFSYTAPSGIMTTSCGHVIPKSSLVVWPVTAGVDGQEFDFTFARRNEMMPRAGRILERLVQQIPKGVVAFFPSYAYLEGCVQLWKKEKLTDDPKSPTIWDALSKRKPIFMEDSRASGQAQSKMNAKTSTGNENLLSAYSNTFNNPESNGGLLLSVINGSLSEGINFSDDLGRGVIVFGLPFPNPHTPEWKAKMEFLKTKTMDAKLAAGSSRYEAEAAGKAAASEFYTNTAMRAVNQAVGRAIRHQKDYAAILVVDRRYNTSRIKDKLPGWIKNSLREPESIQKMEAGLFEFFSQR